MDTERRQYSEEFKKKAVEFILSSNKSVIEVARDLGIAHSTLRRWCAQYRKRGELALPGHAKEKLTPQEKGEEGSKIQKELNDFQIERDILIWLKEPISQKKMKDMAVPVFTGSCCEKAIILAKNA